MQTAIRSGEGEEERERVKNKETLRDKERYIDTDREGRNRIKTGKERQNKTEKDGTERDGQVNKEEVEMETEKQRERGRERGPPGGRSWKVHSNPVAQGAGLLSD